MGLTKNIADRGVRERGKGDHLVPGPRPSGDGCCCLQIWKSGDEAGLEPEQEIGSSILVMVTLRYLLHGQVEMLRRLF